MNNNKRDAAALQARCKGVFSNVGYLNDGAEEKAEDNEDIVRDSYKGKQFLPSCSKSGRTPDTYFGLDKEKKHLYIAEGLPFIDREKFQESQPEKPGKGFLTSDYNRRGEFTNTIRTEQYRDQLKQEEKIVKKRPIQKLPPNDLAPLPSKARKEAFLYDRVFDRSPPKRAAQKLPRDTGNPTMLSKDRNVGPYDSAQLVSSQVDLKTQRLLQACLLTVCLAECMTMYLLQFCKPKQVSLPKHGRVAVVRDTFYDKDMSAFNPS